MRFQVSGVRFQGATLNGFHRRGAEDAETDKRKADPSLRTRRPSAGSGQAGIPFGELRAGGMTSGGGAEASFSEEKAVAPFDFAQG